MEYSHVRPETLASLLSVAGGGGNDDILDQFDSVTAAKDYGPLPKGSYLCLAIAGKKTTARTGTSGYTVEFRVIDGEFTGRHLWRTWYFTSSALPYTKRELQKFGLVSKKDLSAPFPANRLVFLLTVKVRRDDYDTERNEVTGLRFIRLQEPEANPFPLEDSRGEQ